MILSEKIFLHLHCYPVACEQALGQTLDFGKFVLEKIPEGIQLSLIEIHLRSGGIHPSRPSVRQGLEEPLPADSYNAEEFQIKRGVRQEEVYLSLHGKADQMRRDLL